MGWKGADKQAVVLHHKSYDATCISTEACAKISVRDKVIWHYL